MDFSIDCMDAEFVEINVASINHGIDDSVDRASYLREVAPLF